MRRIETVAKRELTPEQETGLMALLEGVSDEAAAERAGVSRATIARWKTSDALFVARMNAALEQQWSTHLTRLEALRGKALDVMQKALGSDDAAVSFRAAQVLLRMSGEKPSGPTTEDAVTLSWWSPY